MRNALRFSSSGQLRNVQVSHGETSHTEPEAVQQAGKCAASAKEPAEPAQRRSRRWSWPNSDAPAGQQGKSLLSQLWPLTLVPAGRRLLAEHVIRSRSHGDKSHTDTAHRTASSSGGAPEN